ncbi:Photosystem II 10 kDa polypeptide [Hibiscus syriacus]|uniref:Photosystem II 10 kDa polypeptide, chloroplastic n=1 Tax=Hibiscus syriacus TaxID=106335 RepID=A0A6A2YPF5_HIBSY|nr:Photosystem II 10 kDa polypeptide [Hibiscus syriacus]
MDASVMASVSLKPSFSSFEKNPGFSRGGDVPSLARVPSSFKVEASKVAKKINTDKPYGINVDLKLKDGVDASRRRAKEKGVYQYVNKYGANVDGYSPIYDPNDWSPAGDVYTGGKTGLVIWAVTLAGILAGGALLVYNTSALAQ